MIKIIFCHFVAKHTCQYIHANSHMSAKTIPAHLSGRHICYSYSKEHLKPPGKYCFNIFLINMGNKFEVVNE